MFGVLVFVASGEADDPGTLRNDRHKRKTVPELRRTV